MKAEQEQQSRGFENETEADRKAKFNPKALLQSDFDFEALSKKLTELSDAQTYDKSPTAQVLDKIKPALIHARDVGMTISRLHLFLVANGIRISKPTLRTYLAEKRVKTSRKTTGKPRNKGTSPSAASNAEDRPSSSQETKAPPPRGRMR